MKIQKTKSRATMPYVFVIVIGCSVLAALFFSMRSQDEPALQPKFSENTTKRVERPSSLSIRPLEDPAVKKGNKDEGVNRNDDQPMSGEETRPETPEKVAEISKKIYNAFRVEPSLDPITQNPVFALSPGQNAEKFKALGFEDGDLLSEIDGNIISNTPYALVDFLNDLAIEKEVRLTVIREGYSIGITVKLADLEE